MKLIATLLGNKPDGQDDEPINGSTTPDKDEMDYYDMIHDYLSTSMLSSK